MLRSNAIEQFNAHIEGVYAFRIKGELSKDDVEAMAEVMNDAFDQREEVDMLLAFESDEGAEFGAGLSLEAFKSQFRSLTKVRNYCVANAPDSAESLINFFDTILPVEARTFSSEHNAIEHLRAQPAPKRAAA